MTARVSAVMAVYDQVRPEHLAEALASLEAQTLRPVEVLVVMDGPSTPALDAVLCDAGERLPLRRIDLPRRSGSGPARNRGLAEATCDLVAITDADDISKPDRLHRQVTDLVRDDLDIHGTAMEEIDSVTGEPLGVRRFPSEHAELRRMMAIKNPLNQPSVLIRRSAALAVGGYRSLPLLEDYDLWARVVGAGGRIGNTPEPLVVFRGGDAMLVRRRSLVAVRSEWELQRVLRAAGVISGWRMPVNWAVRNGFRVLPVWLMRRVYRGTWLRPSTRAGDHDS